jgi:plasmid stabilization system protein ParE
MGQVHWSEPALADLRDIVSFVARDSPAYAARLASRISEAPRRLASFPRLGQIVPELNQPSIREL